MKLLHYNCDHGFNGILRTGTIRPAPFLWHDSIPPLVWLTDMRQPERDALGLTSENLTCDRLEFRFVVRVTDARPWTPFADEARFSGEWREAMESFGQPDRWWVALAPITSWRVDDAWRHRRAA